MGANPVDGSKPGSRLHLVCHSGGLPLTAVVTAANINDTAMFQAVAEDIPGPCAVWAAAHPTGRRSRRQRR